MTGMRVLLLELSELELELEGSLLLLLLLLLFSEVVLLVGEPGMVCWCKWCTTLRNELA